MGKGFDVDTELGSWEGRSNPGFEISEEGVVMPAELLEPLGIDLFGSLDFGYASWSQRSVENAGARLTIYLPANVAHEI